MIDFWPILAIALAAGAAALIARRRAELPPRRQPRPPVAVLRPTPPTPGRIVDVRADPRLASFWRDVRARERQGSGDTPDADALLRRLYPEE